MRSTHVRQGGGGRGANRRCNWSNSFVRELSESRLEAEFGIIVGNLFVSFTGFLFRIVPVFLFGIAVVFLY